MIKLLKKYGFVPRVAVWELTLRCNLNCRHCGSRAGKPRDNEMSLEECLKLANDLADMKLRFLTLGGGEPLMRKDWALIAETLIERGVTVGMVTNGMLWSDEVARVAKTIGLESVAFSIDGLEENDEYIRRTPGHFKKALDAAVSCGKVGLKASVVTTITRRNLPELERMRDVLRDHGVLRWQLQLGTPTGNMADHPDLVLQPEDMLTVVPLIAAMCRDKKLPKVYPGHDIGYFGEPEEYLRNPEDPIPFWTGCSAGCSVIGIESNGNIKGCLSLPSSMEKIDAFVEGNVRKAPLREIWTRKGAFAYNREFTTDNLAGFCHTCDYGEICRGGCTWINFATSGNKRDNPYCYWRQLKLKEARDRGEIPKEPVKLPVVG
ncbi:MAG: radical SAM protein [Deltaproteobacteria bacterium]|nr:radical SAM protein [Deltaproteobacteria bacterium]